MQQSKFVGLQFTKYGLLTPEHEAIRFLRNIGNHLAQSALCNTPEDLNFQQYSCETATMKEELEKKLIWIVVMRTKEMGQCGLDWKFRN